MEVGVAVSKERERIKDIERHRDGVGRVEHRLGIYKKEVVGGYGKGVPKLIPLLVLQLSGQLKEWLQRTEREGGRKDRRMGSGPEMSDAKVEQ